MTTRLITSTLGANAMDFERNNHDVLAQLKADVVSRVHEQRYAEGLTPLGAVMVKVTAEQWVSDEEIAIEPPGEE